MWVRLGADWSHRAVEGRATGSKSIAVAVYLELPDLCRLRAALLLSICHRWWTSPEDIITNHIQLREEILW